MTAPTPADLSSPTAGLTSEELEDIATELETPDPDDTEDEAPAAPAAPAPTSGSPLPAPSDAQPLATAPVSPAASAPATAPLEQPFAFRVDQTDVSIPGITKAADGSVRITPDAWNTLRAQHLGNRAAWSAREQRYQQQVRALEQRDHQALSVNEARANAVLAAITKAAEQGEQAVYDLALGFAAKLPQLTARGEAEYWRRQAEGATQRLRPIDQQADLEANRAWLQDSVEQYVAEAVKDPRYAALVGQEERIVKAFHELEGDLFYRDSEGWKIAGSVFYRELGREAAHAKEAAELRAQVTKAAEVQHRNAAALAPTASVPPTAPAKAGAAPPSSEEGQRPKNYREWQDKMHRLANDENL